MYRDIQEPLMNAAQEQFGSNPFQALAGSRSGSSQNSSATQGGPVPNPWAPPSQTTGRSHVFKILGCLVVKKKKLFRDTLQFPGLWLTDRSVDETF